MTTIRTRVPDVAAAFAQPDSPTGRTMTVVQYHNHTENFIDGVGREEGRFLVISTPDQEDELIALRSVQAWHEAAFEPLAWRYAGS